MTVSRSTAYYAAPKAGRLQISSGALIAAGFKPGQRYTVRKTPTGVSIYATDRGAYSVTNHKKDSGVPKAYVSAGFMRELKAQTLRVNVARRGLVMVRAVG